LLAPTLQSPWREVEPTPDRGSQCTTFRPDLSAFTITGKARPAMKTGTGSRHVRQPYPVEVFVFRAGRAVGAAFFTFVADKADELRQARLVAARLRGV